MKRSRFDSFNNKKIQIHNSNGDPLNKQVYFNGCILEFVDGYISSENIEIPAIQCVDAYMEFWKDGVYFEAISLYAGDDKVESFKMGKEAEINFANYLNDNNISFIHLDQLNIKPEEPLYSKEFSRLIMKRPDYIVFINNKPYFIDVKSVSANTLEKNDLDKLKKLEDQYSIKVIYAINNKKENNGYLFLTLENMNAFIEIFHENIGDKYKEPWDYYPIPSELLKNEIIHGKEKNEKLREIFINQNKRYNDKMNYYSNSIINYFNEIGYKVIK